jgi:hypothetical protein
MALDIMKILMSNQVKVIKKSVFEDELIAGMQKELTANDQSAAIEHLDVAIDSLHSAVEIFEEAGMTNQADAVLNILLKFAKNQSNFEKNVKRVDPHTKGLTSEKMVANWKDHGSWFNADDGGIDELLDADMNGEDLDISDANFEDMDFEEEL